MNIDFSKPLMVNGAVLHLNETDIYPTRQDLGLFGHEETAFRLIYSIDQIGTELLQNGQSIPKYQLSFEAISAKTMQPIPNSGIAIAGNYSRPKVPLNKSQLDYLAAQFHSSYWVKTNQASTSCDIQIIPKILGSGHGHSKTDNAKAKTPPVVEFRAADQRHITAGSEGESKSTGSLKIRQQSIFGHENRGRGKDPLKAALVLDPQDQAQLAAVIKMKIAAKQPYDEERQRALNNIKAFKELATVEQRHYQRLAQLAGCDDEAICKAVLERFIVNLRDSIGLDGSILMGINDALRFTKPELRNHNLINQALSKMDEKCAEFLHSKRNSNELSLILGGMNGIVEIALESEVENISLLLTQKPLYQFYKSIRKNPKWSQRIRNLAARGVQGAIRLNVDVSDKKRKRMQFFSALKALAHIGDAVYNVNVEGAIKAYKEYKLAISLKRDGEEEWFDDLVYLEAISRKDFALFGKEFLVIAKRYVSDKSGNLSTEVDSPVSTSKSTSSSHKSNEDSTISTNDSAISSTSSKNSLTSVSSQGSLEDSSRYALHLSSSHYLLSGIIEHLSVVTTFDGDPKRQHEALAFLAEFLMPDEEGMEEEELAETRTPTANALKTLFFELSDHTQDAVCAELALRFMEWIVSTDSQINQSAKSFLISIVGLKPKWLKVFKGELTRVYVSKMVPSNSSDEMTRKNTLMKDADKIELDIEEAIKKFIKLETDHAVNMALKNRMDRYVTPVIKDAFGRQVDPVEILQLLRSNKAHKVMILQGPAGVGKSTIVQHYYDVVMEESKSAENLIAALMNLGLVVNARSKTPLPDSYQSRSNGILSESHARKLCSNPKQVHLVVTDSWDEQCKRAVNSIRLVPIKQIHPDSKIIIALRTQDVTYCQETEHLFAPIEDGVTLTSQVVVYTVHSFTEDKILEYLQKANNAPIAPWKFKMKIKDEHSKEDKEIQPYLAFKDAKEYIRIFKEHGLMEMAGIGGILEGLFLVLPEMHKRLGSKGALLTLELEMNKKLREKWYQRELIKRGENLVPSDPRRKFINEAKVYDEKAAALMYRNKWIYLTRPKSTCEESEEYNPNYKQKQSIIDLNWLFSSSQSDVLRASFLKPEDNLPTGDQLDDNLEGRKYSFQFESRHNLCVMECMVREVMSENFNGKSLLSLWPISSDLLVKYLAMEAHGNIEFRKKLAGLQKKGLGEFTHAATNATKVMTLLKQIDPHIKVFDKQEEKEAPLKVHT